MVQIASVPPRESTAGWVVYHESNSLRRGQVPSVRGGEDYSLFGKAAYVCRTRAEAGSHGREVHALILSYSAQIAPNVIWAEAQREARRRGFDSLEERNIAAQKTLAAMGYDGVCGHTGTEGQLTIAVWTDGLLKRDAAQARAA